jgi:hypothetical protein
MDNPEKQATLIEVAIKNGQSRETECIGHKMQNEDKQNTKHKTAQFVGCIHSDNTLYGILITD